jgi:hypothetical protein
MSNTNTQPNINLNEMQNLLVKAMTGISIDEIPTENQQPVIEKSQILMGDFLRDYFSVEYTEEDSNDLVNFANGDQTVLTKEGFEVKLLVAYRAGIKTIQEMWDQGNISDK